MKPFPEMPFLFGTATSSHQIEGHNTQNDWWFWEQKKYLKYPSGSACNHWHLFLEDLDLMKALGHTAYRFSIEWSRIEPQCGVWDESALKWYQNLLRELKQRKIEPVVTLHHFTNPLWLTQKGGWDFPEAPYYFNRFVQKVVESLGEHVRFWITLNEPLVYLFHGYFLGVWPPGYRTFWNLARALKSLVLGHVEAYQSIHAIYEKKFSHRPYVSFSKHMTFMQPCRPYHPFDWLATGLRNWFQNHMFLDACINGFLFFPGVFCEPLKAHHTVDFLAVNYYSRNFIRLNFERKEGIFGSDCQEAHHDAQVKERNTLGWEIYPEGLHRLLEDLKSYQLPVLITENGICTEDDTQRQRFIRDHLQALVRARESGVSVLGYLHWSLLDNFEWAEGFAPHFGIVGVEPQKFTRKIKDSAYVLSEFCRKL